MAVLTRYGGKAKILSVTPATARTHGFVMITMTSGRPGIVYQSDLGHLEPSFNTKPVCYVAQIFMKVLLVVNFKLPSGLSYK